MMSRKIQVKTVGRADYNSLNAKIKQTKRHTISTTGTRITVATPPFLGVCGHFRRVLLPFSVVLSSTN